jgi:hypothetical protein
MEVIQPKHKMALNILFASLISAQLGFAVYMYTQGRKGNPKYTPFSDLIHNPTWQRFRIWFATMANDPVIDIVLTLTFVLIPFPFLPAFAHQRIELFLSKIGLYQILVTIILGKPNYDAKKKQKVQDYMGGSIFIAILLGLFIWSKKRSKTIQVH